jgi:hypothetical protein
MPFDPELLAEARAWILKAATDLRATEAMLALDPPLLEVAVLLTVETVAGRDDFCGLKPAAAG